MKIFSRKRIYILILILLLFTPELSINAADLDPEMYSEETIKEGLIENFDFDNIDDSVRELFPKEQMDFRGIVEEILSGDLELTGSLLNQIIKEQLFYVLQTNKENLIRMILIAVIAAVLSNFSRMFQSRQMSDICFYAMYLLLIALSLNAFELTITWVEDGIHGLTSFMGLFCPLYFISVSIAKGSVTAVAFYNLVLFLIYFIEVLITEVLLPVIHIYMIIKVLDFLSEESFLSKLAQLIETIVSWILKTLLAFLVGINIIQGMISPAIDTVKQSLLTRSVEALPGIGDAIGGMAEVAMGTAVLVKNGIGMAGAVIIIAICLVPIVQLGIIILIYRLTAAVLQPISDGRVVGCVEAVSDGCSLLMKTVFTVSILFLLTIAISVMITNNI